MMTKKEFIKHYSSILNFPNLEIHPERTDDLKDEIQRLADIYKIPYRVAIEKIGSAFLRQSLETDPDDNNFGKNNKRL